MTPTSLLRRGQGSPEQEDVRLGLVGHVVDPSLGLLDPDGPPLGLGHEVGAGDLK